MEENRPRYKRGWVIAGFCLAAFTLVGLMFFMRQTYIYYQGLKRGETYEKLMSVRQGESEQTEQVKVTAEQAKKIKELVAAHPGDPYIGADTSTHEIVEFLDFGCPYCKNAEPAVRELARLRPNVRISFRDYPVTDLHPFAELAAQSARCVWLQAQPMVYWRFREQVFADQDHMDDSSLRDKAVQAGANMSGYDRCRASLETLSSMRQSINDAQAAGVRGTPTFFVDGHMVEGQAGYADLIKALEP